MAPLNRQTRRQPSTLTDRDERILVLLGELKSGFDGLREDMAEVKTAATADRKDASESRARMYLKIDDALVHVSKMESTLVVVGGIVDKQTTRLDALEPIVKKTASTVRIWTIRSGMIATAVVAVGGASWGLVSSYVPQIISFINSMTSGKN